MKKAFILVVFGILIMLLLSGGIFDREYEQIAKKVASENKYDFSDNNCDSFSDELVLRLKEKGWFAWKEVIEAPMERCSQGAEKYGFEWNYDSCPHSITFIAIPIESVSGQIITPKDWNKKGYKWRLHPEDDFPECDACLRQLK